MYLGILWITLLLAGCNTAGVDPISQEGIRLTDVTQESGLAAFRHFNGGFGEAWAPEIVGAGGAFIDYDNDGWLDIMLVAGGNFKDRSDRDVETIWVFRNQGGGRFLRVNGIGFDELRTYGLGITASDYDNDGDTDVFLTTLYENLLFQNNGGVFLEVGEEAGVSTTRAWSTSALFFDANNDGWLDLYVGQYVQWSPETDQPCMFEGEKVFCTPEEYEGLPGTFYLNNGDGTFQDATASAGFLEGIAAERDKTLGVAELDYNLDGWTDLFIANDTERDLLFENQGDGTFVEKGILSGIAYDMHGKARAGMGVDVGVVDSSLHPSLFVGNFSDETVGVYRYMGNGLFTDRATTSKIGHRSIRTLTFGLFLFDVDLDTDLDLLTANGHVQTHIERMLEGVTFKQPVQLYRNRGNGIFDEEQHTEGPLAQPLVARGAMYGDYDNDGDLDVLITENNGPAHLWRNDTRTTGFLRVDLEGRTSNRDALGARILAQVDGLTMERRVRTGSSYLSQSERIQTFGLGNHTEVDSLTIFWPSGRVDRFYAVPANQVVRIIEDTGALEGTPIKEL